MFCLTLRFLVMYILSSDLKRLEDRFLQRGELENER